MINKYSIGQPKLAKYGVDRFLLLKDTLSESRMARHDLKTRVARKMFVDEEVSSAIWRCLKDNLNVSEEVSE